jgi:hypothetical protein
MPKALIVAGDPLVCIPILRITISIVGKLVRPVVLGILDPYGTDYIFTL